MEQNSAASDNPEIAVEATAPATASQNDELALKLVERFSLWSGAAGLIPVPFVDVATVTGVQLQMLRKLCALYGVRFTENLGKSVVASLLGSIVPATSGLGTISVLKGIPFVGTTVGVISMPALSAGATYVIGRVFIQHFASGGTLLDFRAPDYREFIKAQSEKLKQKFGAAPPEHAATPAAVTPGEQAAASGN